MNIIYIFTVWQFKKINLHPPCVILGHDLISNVTQPVKHYTQILHLRRYHPRPGHQPRSHNFCLKTGMGIYSIYFRQQLPQQFQLQLQQRLPLLLGALPVPLPPPKINYSLLFLPF